ncbi:hypothetical protein BN871_AJ_00790 [Paenibacillus sp. P22]|nr:hypothetical protein BN871_AJ_00790 [Paenibacillus sp. P22]
MLRGFLAGNPMLRIRHEQQLLRLRASLVQLHPHPRRHERIRLAVDEQHRHLRLLDLFKSGSLAEEIAGPELGHQARQGQKRKRRQLVHPLELIDELVLRGCVGAIGHDRLHLGRQFLAARHAYRGAAHRYPMQDDFRAGADPPGRPVDPADIILAFMPAEADIAASAPAVPSRVRHEHVPPQNFSVVTGKHSHLRRLSRIAVCQDGGTAAFSLARKPIGLQVQAVVGNQMDPLRVPASEPYLLFPLGWVQLGDGRFLRREIGVAFQISLGRARDGDAIEIHAGRRQQKQQSGRGRSRPKPNRHGVSVFLSLEDPAVFLAPAVPMTAYAIQYIPSGKFLHACRRIPQQTLPERAPLQDSKKGWSGQPGPALAQLCLFDDFDASLDWSELFFPGRSRRLAERHLSDQLPALGQLPSLLDLLVDERIVMLQRSAETFRLECRPYDELQHAGRLAGPFREVVLVGRELILKAPHDILVLEEQDRAVAGFEARHALLGLIKAFAAAGHGAKRLQRQIPQLVGLLVEQHQYTGALGIESRWRMVDGFFNNGLHFFFGDHFFLADGIKRTTTFYRCEKLFGRHVV